ncbi:Outer membrane porin protein [Pandoraea terrae]|uniref:Outer membrane porin protein n=1 Tax=Pandoraea terrae TaxID=1537710 RepID=A0A5E4XJZ6_9BURK|nr:porin [Pandoraea terrae]VVE36472.1 Outer membrane porin protein [Pandoraea terrae]
MIKLGTIPMGMAVAVAAAIPAVSSAQSSVTLYGAVDNALAYTNNQKGSSNVYLKSGSLESAKFGFKGQEDLGGGSRALFRLESGFNLNNGMMSDQGAIFSRLAWVALANDRYGTLTLGRQYTPYLLYVGAIGAAPMLTGATGAHPGDIDQLDVDSRASNAVTYSTPDMNGLQFSTMYALGGVAGAFSSGNTFSAALKYNYKTLDAAVGYLRVTNNAVAGTFSTTATGTFDQSPINAGYVSAHAVQYIAAAALYGFGAAKVGVNYANTQYKPGVGSLFTDTAIFNNYGVIGQYSATIAWTLAAGYSYTRATASNGVTNAARFHQFSFEQTYSLSKRSTIYLLEAYQMASGQTLSAQGKGHIVNSVAMVGRTSESTPSSNGRQFVGMIGFRHAF